MGERKMVAKLNNAVAATAIGAFLRRLAGKDVIRIGGRPNM
jgi:hypothetical protein